MIARARPGNVTANFDHFMVFLSGAKANWLPVKTKIKAIPDLAANDYSRAHR
jgi:hypothetical protein